jgi:tRNA(Ile)-lysidine synthase
VRALGTALTPEGLADRLTALGGADWARGQPVAVAVSGGADSLALLKLAAAAFGAQLRALTFDHGLRAASTGEARMVAAIAHGLGMPHATLGPVPLAAGVGLQAAAREARYAAFADWCRAHGVAVLLTAHHADDQAETLLMRIGRGAGLAGLAGIRARQRIAGLLVIRPFLDVSRARLRAVLDGTGWMPAEDPSNADDRFDRSKVRKWLSATPGLDPVRASASASHLAEADAAIDWAVAQAWASRWGEGGLDLGGLPAEIARRLLARALAERGADARGDAVARLHARGGGTLGGIVARSDGGVWRFRPAPPRRLSEGRRRP